MSERIFKIEELEFRKDLYPRASGKTFWFVWNKYAEEMKAGAVFPPIKVGTIKGTGDRAIVVDGWHRCEALKRLDIDYVKGTLREYVDEKELFLDAVASNSSHGFFMSSIDKVHIVRRLKDFKLTPIEISKITQIPVGNLRQFEARVLDGPEGKIYLKAPVFHLMDRGSITAEQASAADQKHFTVRRVEDILHQLISFLEGDIYPWGDMGVRALTDTVIGLLSRAPPRDNA